MTLPPEAIAAIWLSLRVALVATLVAMPFAVWIGHGLARRSGVLWQFVNLAVHLPLVLPPVVTGYALLVTFGTVPFFAFRWTGAALAAGIMAFPLMVRAVRLGVEAVDPGLEEAAATLGAGRGRVFLTVTLPLIAPGLIAAFVLGLAKALGEFGATITFVAAIPGQTQTIPAAIYTFLQVPGQEGVVVALALVSVTLAVGALVVSEWMSRAMRRRLAA